MSSLNEEEKNERKEALAAARAERDEARTTLARMGTDYVTKETLYHVATALTGVAGLGTVDAVKQIIAERRPFAALLKEAQAKIEAYVKECMAREVENSTLASSETSPVSSHPIETNT
jgi:hypothetical protein